MKQEHTLLNRPINRRQFLRATAVLGGTISMGGLLRPLQAQGIAPTLYGLPGPNPVDTAAGLKTVRSVCLMCHSACGIQCLVDPAGQLLKIDGNPYHPNTRDPHLPYATDPATIVGERSRICAKGQAGMEQAYTPLRVKHPLKRVGARGSNEWEVISWDQAFTEIIEGGDLFGEGHVDGLRQIRDLETPIDPEAPELGPKANQAVFAVGRHEHGRKEFTDAFWKYAYGTINYRNDHTSICELSHHIAYGLAFGGKSHFKPDILNSKYIIWWGTSPLEANFPMIALSRKLMEFKKRGGKMVVVDPRFSTSAAKADVWLPVKPGTDAALALAISRWIVDNKKYDENFLRNTAKAGATANGESSWCNATYLVRLDTNTLLRGDAAGLGEASDYVVVAGGQPVVHSDVAQADLEATLEVNGIACKSVFTLFKERLQEKTVEEYAAICGVDADLIVQVASDFAAAGKQAISDFYRGIVQHTNGTHTALAILAHNMLVGNVDWKGGLVVGGSHWHEDGSKSTNVYKMKAWPSTDDPRRVSASGVLVSRDNKSSVRYEDTTEFKKNGYPAKRPWFPLTNMIWQELFAGIADGYPYPIKALVLAMGNPAFTAPAGNKIEETLKDTTKVPLYVSIDRVMSEAASVADYVLPDVGYLERYETPHVAPTIQTKTSGFRQPFWQEEDGHVLPKAHKVLPDTMDLVDMLIEIGKRMNLAGCGDDGWAPGMPMNESRDWFAKMAANIAAESGGVPGATEAERIRYLLDRGGRFEDADQAYDGDKVTHKYGKAINLFVERLATTKNVMTGEAFDPLPKYEPIKDAKGNLVQDDAYPFHLTTYHPVMHTQSRSIENDLLLSIMDQNWVEIHADDAASLGLRTGDRVRVTSHSNAEGIVGHAKVGHSVARGVVAIAMSFGHWQYGAAAWKTDGQAGQADAKRGRGVNSNLVMRVDDSIGNVCLEDLIGGSASFYDTRVNIQRA